MTTMTEPVLLELHPTNVTLIVDEQIYPGTLRSYRMPTLNVESDDPKIARVWTITASGERDALYLYTPKLALLPDTGQIMLIGMSEDAFNKGRGHS
jgi:hypothetical protein